MSPLPAPSPARDTRHATRYHGPGDIPLGPLWLVHESRVIADLAQAGGDLQAHRTVHLEDR